MQKRQGKWQMNKFKAGDRVRIKDGTKDPDVEWYDISGQTGEVIGDNGEFVEIELDQECIDNMSADAKYELRHQTIETIFLEENELEQETDLLKPQPEPVSAGVPVYDFLCPLLEQHKASDEIMSLVENRYKQGLEKYGQPLMTGDGRDTKSDLVQEVVDALYYCAKGIHNGSDWNAAFGVLVFALNLILKE